VSPSRARARRATAKRTRSRQEIVTAAVGAVAVVAVTALAIWAMRPGSAIAGTGGIAHRQPRATWLVVGAIALAIGVTWYVRKSRRWQRSDAANAIALVVIVVGAVLIGILWPKGLLRHYASAEPPPASTTTTTRGTTTTTAAATTTT
jgi:CDP-diglyceride synthetase